METLVQRLVQNPHDQEAITYAHHSGQSDPRSYAMLLEKVGTATSDPAFSSHWLTEAANVWATTLGDAHRAARALMIAIDRDPTQPTPAERLAELYRDKGDTKALVALLERRAKALAPLSQHDPELRAHVAGIHEELGRLWAEAPLNQPKKAVENYKRAVEYDPNSQYAIYAIRELHKGAGQWSEAVPYFAMEQRLISGDVERQVALYQDEAEVRKSAGDLAGATDALRNARAAEGGADAGLKQLLATSILERVQAGERVHATESGEAARLFIELAEEYPGDHGYSYAVCALEVEAGNDRAVQLAMYYAAQLGREGEVGPRAAAYIKANPQGAMAAEARQLVSRAMAETGGDDTMIDALAPPPDAESGERVRGLLDVAEALARKNKKHEAAAKYKEVLALEPSNEEAVAFLEGHLRQTRKYAELRDVLLSASRGPDVDEETKKGWLREVAGLCETQLRDIETAIHAWKQLIAIDSSDEAARGQLRRLLERGGRWDDLATLLEQEAEQTADAEARISMEKALAKIHEQKRKDPVATGETWARIAGLSPDDEVAINTSVRHFEKAERADLAAQVIADNVGSITDERARGQLFKKLGELREATGNALQAGEAFAEGAALAKDPGLWESAERCFAQAQNWEQAAQAVDERAQLALKDKERAALFALEADYLTRGGQDSNAVLRLEQATDLDPVNADYARDLEQRYTTTDRHSDLAAYLMRRSDKLSDKALRSELRRRAAQIQRETLGDADAARECLLQLLNDGDDPQALSLLADDSEQRGEPNEAVDYLHRLAAATEDKAERVKVLLREAKLVSEGLEDRGGAIERYEAILKKNDPTNLEALAAIADLSEANEDFPAVADALERHLKIVEDIEVGQRLADLYEGRLDRAEDAVRVLDIVRRLDPEDYVALERLCMLRERLEDWPKVAEHLAALVEVEGDEAEVSRMTRRLAEILHQKVGKGDEALAALLEVGDQGDEECRKEYVKLGDTLGWKGIVATKLVEWYVEAPAGAERNEALRGAFDRFLEVGRDADAANVAKELARTRGADSELAQRLEDVAVKLKDLDALGIAHDLLVTELSGRARAEEMVRQAEVMVKAAVEPHEAVQHGEQALTSVAPEDVEPLLKRLAQISATPTDVIDLYERQISRCKNPADRLRALARAAQIAAERDAIDRARGFFDLALGGGVQDETLKTLEQTARDSDEDRKTHTLRWTLAEAMAAGGQGSRDGGRTRGALLRRAAKLANDDLGDTDKAFVWLGDAIVTHVDDEGLDALEGLADEVGDSRRAEAVLNRALEEVFDGPLVRKLLGRRASLRQQKLDDKRGAATDLKKLHDLSPSDTTVMEQLSELYVELEDFRGMVQLYEDQILRGKDPATRIDLARKVARLWEEKLDDPREAADAWRRVLRMKSGDPEATEGLERAKQGMLNRPPKSDPPPPPKPAAKAEAAPAAAKPAADAGPEPASEPEAAPAEAPSAPAAAEPEGNGSTMLSDEATVSASFDELQALSAQMSPTPPPDGGALRTSRPPPIPTRRPVPPPPPPGTRPRSPMKPATRIPTSTSTTTS